MSPLTAVMWTIGLSLFEQTCIGTTDALRPGGLTDVVNITACEVLATSIVVWLILRVHAAHSSVREALSVKAIGFADFFTSVVAGAGLRPLLSTLDDLVLRKWPYDAVELESMGKLVARSSRTELVLGIFVIIPVVRELFFRGVLFERLRRSLSPAITAGLTAVLYACSSLDLRAMPSALILGTGLSVLRGATGSVLASIVAHAAFWAVDGIPILGGRDPSADVIYPPKWIVAGAAVALVALLASGRNRGEVRAQ
ncbi:MAG TPA: CPBP family intramembrane glutamic endopeptidase [Polyangiaceae bacterium]|nr:CPBP family intramembrane glutamic endopeptidase [Polyangiaceae bacterium]